MTQPARWLLAPLLVVARRAEVAAREALGDALAVEADRRRDRDEAAAALRGAEDAAAAAGRGPGPGARAGALGARALHLARLGDETERLRGALRRRERGLAEAAALVRTRSGELAASRAAAETLDARREVFEDGLRRARRRAEEDAADELVSARPAGAS